MGVVYVVINIFRRTFVCLLLLQRDLEEETNLLVSSSKVNNADFIKLVDVAITSVFARLHSKLSC